MVSSRPRNVFTSMTNEWHLDSLANSPGNENQERQVLPASQPLDSPTEAATPTDVSTSSIVSPSPSPIRPAAFVRAATRGRTRLDRIAGLEHQLRGVPDHFIRRPLRLSGHSHLLKSLEDSDSDLSYVSKKASFPKVQSKNCDSIREYVDAAVERSLQPHVKKIADENYTLLYDLRRVHEEEFRSEVDDIYSSIRIQADECLHELEERFQESIDQLEARSQRCLDHIQDQGITATEESIAKFRRCLRRNRHHHLRATRSGSRKHKTCLRRFTKRRRRC